MSGRRGSRFCFRGAHLLACCADISPLYFNRRAHLLPPLTAAHTSRSISLCSRVHAQLACSAMAAARSLAPASAPSSDLPHMAASSAASHGRRTASWSPNLPAWSLPSSSRAPAHPLPSPCAWCLYLLRLGDRVPWFLKFDVVPARLGTVGSDHHPHVDGALDSSSSSSVPRRASSAPAIPAQIHPYPCPRRAILCSVRAVFLQHTAPNPCYLFFSATWSLFAARISLLPTTVALIFSFPRAALWR
jgi:hypothetical protein